MKTTSHRLMPYLITWLLRSAANVMPNVMPRTERIVPVYLCISSATRRIQRAYLICRRQCYRVSGKTIDLSIAFDCPQEQSTTQRAREVVPLRSTSRSNHHNGCVFVYSYLISVLWQAFLTNIATSLSPLFPLQHFPQVILSDPSQWHQLPWQFPRLLLKGKISSLFCCVHISHFFSLSNPK